MHASSWACLMGLAAERPVTGVVLDAELVPEDVGLKAAVEEFTVRFPSLWLVLVARSGTDPWGLFGSDVRGLETSCSLTSTSCMRGSRGRFAPASA